MLSSRPWNWRKRCKETEQVPVDYVLKFLSSDNAVVPLVVIWCRVFYIYIDGPIFSIYVMQEAITIVPTPTSTSQKDLHSHILFLFLIPGCRNLSSISPNPHLDMRKQQYTLWHSNSWLQSETSEFKHHKHPSSVWTSPWYSMIWDSFWAIRLGSATTTTVASKHECRSEYHALLVPARLFSYRSKDNIMF